MGNLCNCLYTRKKDGDDIPLLAPNWESLHAAKTGDLVTLQEQYRKYNIKHLEIPDEEGLTVLHISSCNGRLNILVWLIETINMKPNTPDSHGWTPLHHSCYSGKQEIVNYLLKLGEINVNQADRKGNTPAHVASEAGKVEILKILSQHPSINFSQKNKRGQTPLHIAVIRDLTPVVHWLLVSAKVSSNISDSERNTPLHYASQKSNPSLVTLLVDSGAKIDVKNYQGFTPLTRASTSSKNILVEYHYIELSKKIKKSGILDLHGNDLNNEQLDFMWRKLYQHIDVSNFLREVRLFNNLLKEFPTWINQLSKLEELYVAHNLITKVPESFSQLTNLKKLDFDFLALPLEIKKDDDSSGSESEEESPRIELRKSYKRLKSVRKNRTEISLPESFGNLVNLETLSLTDNGLTKLPDSFGNLTKLDSLNLKNNSFTEFPECLFTCSSLRELSIEGNLLKTVPESITHITKLELINLDYNPLKYFPIGLQSNSLFNWLAELKGIPFQ